MTQRDRVSLLGVAAALAVVVGVSLHPLASVPAIVVAGALAFAGAPRVGCVVVVMLTLAAVAGLRIDADDRPSHVMSGRVR